MRRFLVALSLLVALPLGAQQQDSIAAIRANPQKYWNLEVNVAGLVGRAESSFPGGQLGTYRLVDYTDSTGIAIESDELPAPGRVLRVRGIVVPSRDNATIPIIREKERQSLDKPEWLLWVVVIAGVVALALGGALWYFIRRNPADAPGVPLSDAARPPVPIVIGGPVRMAPPPVYMPWAQPDQRPSGGMFRPSLDGPMAPPKGPPPGAGTLPRTTPNGTPIVRHTPGGTPVVPGEGEGATVGDASASTAPPVRPARPTVPVQRSILGGPMVANPFAMPPRPPSQRAPITQPFEPRPPKTEPFEYTGARLEVVEGPDVGRKLPIGSNALLIGREGGRRNHFPLTDPTVSTAQARILRDETFGFVLENEGKTNVTMVNGEPANEPVALEDGMELRMGATLIRFKLGA
ncbi:MAG: FHA domain-containing protein [Gemmatimonadetes bacterium]|nr:FHA domain-containing protein [Gemmatimonadota bacterium]